LVSVTRVRNIAPPGLERALSSYVLYKSLAILSPLPRPTPRGGARSGAASGGRDDGGITRGLTHRSAPASGCGQPARLFDPREVSDGQVACASGRNRRGGEDRLSAAVPLSRRRNARRRPAGQPATA